VRRDTARSDASPVGIVGRSADGPRPRPDRPRGEVGRRAGSDRSGDRHRRAGPGQDREN